MKYKTQRDAAYLVPCQPWTDKLQEICVVANNIWLVIIGICY